MQRYFGQTFVAGLLLWLAGSFASAETNPNVVRPNDDDRVVTRQVIKTLETEHISHQRFDESLYTRTINKLVDTLDGRRVLFSKLDLEPFSNNPKLNSDSIRAGDPTVLFRLVDLWQARLSARLSQLAATPIDVNSNETAIQFGDRPAEFAATRQELDERWRQHLQFELSLIRNLSSQPSNPLELLVDSYRESLSEWKENLDPLTVSLDAVARAYDPYSGYWGDKQLSYYRCRSGQLQLRALNEKAGIGIGSKWRDGFLVVTEITPGGSASRHNLSIGDRILAVADETTSRVRIPYSWNIAATQKLLVGEPGTNVLLIVHSELPHQKASIQERRFANPK